MRSYVPAWVRRVCLLTVTFIGFAVLAGATYQGVATAIERRTFPHPGRLIDVGGHQLHVHCTGAGVPTIVLEAPAASMSTAWGLVQEALTPTTRVCSYDRAGLGWSEAGDGPFAPARAVDDLGALLDAAHERAPFIVVGRGLGAALARAFAGRHADRTAALVMIEAPDEAAGLRDGPLARVTSVTPWLARVGIRRALQSGKEAAAGLPEPGAGAFRTFLYRPDHLSRAAAEVAMWRQVVRQAGAIEPIAPVYTAPGDADGIIAAIESAVARARASTPNSTPK